MTSQTLRVLICDDDPNQYGILSTYLEREGFHCDPRVDRFEDLRSKIIDSYRLRQWYSFIMIDIDLSKSGEQYTGIDCYSHLSAEFPGEAYVIYTSEDVNPFRQKMNRLLYRDVELVLLEKLIDKEDIRFYLKRIVQEHNYSKIFIVQGRNDEKVGKISRLLTKGFGLEVIAWQDARDQVRSDHKSVFDIVLAGIEMSACTLVLLTDDEEVELRSEFRIKSDFEENRGKAGEKRRQARPNVYIEAGYAFGRRPNRTVFVEWPDRIDLFEAPSDWGGIYTVRFDDGPQSREHLKRVLENARCQLKPRKDWKSMKV